MDTSQIYVKMCGKAEEIQRQWKPKWADWCFGKCVTQCGCLVSEPKIYCFDPAEEDCWYECIPVGWDYNRWEAKTDTIWLARQDELQGMLEEIKDKNHFIFRFYHFLQSRYLKITHQNAYVVLYNEFDNCSMEKLWLAFVMKEKFGKVWNGENWVNEDM